MRAKDAIAPLPKSVNYHRVNGGRISLHSQNMKIHKCLAYAFDLDGKSLPILD